MELNIKLAKLQTAVTETQVLLASNEPNSVIRELELQSHRLAALIPRVHHLVTNAGAEIHDTVRQQAFISLDDAEDMNIQVNVRLNQLFRENPPPQFANATHPSQPVTKQLELKVPIFDGDRTQYNSFKQAVQIACQRKNTTPVEKLLFVTQHLGTEPTKIIENIEYKDENLNLVWELLDAEYSDPARIKADIFTQLTELTPATEEPASMKDTIDRVEALLRVLETYKTYDQEVNGNELIRRLVITKFPRSIIRHITPIGKTPTLAEIRVNLRAQIKAELDVYTIAKANNHIAEVQSPILCTPLAANAIPASNEVPESKNIRNQRGNIPKCAFCMQEHYSSECSKFTTINARQQALGSNCNVCLRSGHTKDKCQSKRTCYHCKDRNHHTSLCPTRYPDREPAKTDHQQDSSLKTENPSKATSVSLLRAHRSNHITARAQIKNPKCGTPITVRVLFDCGAPESFILDITADKLKLTKFEATNLNVYVFGSTKHQTLPSNLVTFDMIIPGQRPITIFADTTPHIQDHLSTFDIERFKADHPQFNHLQFADPADGEQLQVLIGNDYLLECLDFSTQTLVETGLYILKSSLGWHIVGRMPKNRNSSTVMLTTKKALESIWSLDTLGIHDVNESLIKEEEHALHEFQENLKFANNRYEVTMPWRNNPPMIPSNYALAKGVLRSVLKRYDKDRKYLHECDRIFQQQLQQGIIEKANPLPPGTPSHYLPFHFVIRDEKTTKLRVVYNGSAKSGPDQSMNEQLYKGANLLTDIPPIILRFRLKKFALTADIQTAYHTLGLQEQDRDYFRFLWVRNFDEPIEQHHLQIYRFARVPFGIITSSFLLAATINHHLRQYNDDTSQILINSIYVDNVITGADTIEGAQRIIEQSIKIFAEAGMNLRQWNSNDRCLLNNIPENIRDSNDTWLKILGIKWNLPDDTLQITAPSEFDTTQPLTLRRILKYTSKIFDPLGWIAPATIQAKLIIQRLHSQKIGWDEPVSKEIADAWNATLESLRHIDTIKIPRNICPLPNQRTTLHIFSDASQHAYACAAYLRIENGAQITTHLIYAKARVAPLEKPSIPRLELLAALISVRTLSYIRSAFDFPATIWIDSRCVLHWIRSHAAVPRFIRNRLNEIKKAENVDFRYIRSNQNSADLPSRGCTTQELQNNQLWFHGPHWLSKPESQWPEPWSTHDAEASQQQSQNVASEQPEISIHLNTPREFQPPFGIDISRFTNLTALLRTTAYCIAFSRKKQNSTRREILPFAKLPPILHAKLWWIRAAQEHAFANEIQLLQNKKTNTLIKKLRIFIDNMGILRAAGRLNNAPISWWEKNPILLPQVKHSQLTALIIQDAHETNLHAGPNATLSCLRVMFWIPAGRRNVSTIIRQCNPCRRERSRPFQQPTESSLPPFRLLGSALPFSYIGIDIAGHIWLTGPQEKVWILIIACLNTRAIALEPLYDLTARTSYIAFARFSARRTTPIFVLSDNGPQLLVLKTEVQKHRADPFDWKTIPAYAPNEGGAYERLIKLVKTSLFRTLVNHRISSRDEFHTLLYKIEAVINDRPLTYLPDEPGAPALTPNHFLQTRLPQIRDETSPTSGPARLLREAYRHQKEVLQQFQARWYRDYLQYLRERTSTQSFKRATTRRTPRIGDIVLIEDTNVQKKNWKMARIIQLHTSTDGQVRSVVLQLPSKTKIVRPLEKVFDLELNSDM